MKYEELALAISRMTDVQKHSDVTVRLAANGEYYPVERCSIVAASDVLDAGHPVLETAAETVEADPAAKAFNHLSVKQQISLASAETAREALLALMSKHRDLGAEDSEGWQALGEVEEAAQAGKPFPLRGGNPFQIFESEPGWETAAAELVEAARAYFEALSTKKSHSVSIDGDEFTREEAARLRALGLIEVCLDSACGHAFHAVEGCTEEYLRGALLPADQR